MYLQMYEGQIRVEQLGGYLTGQLILSEMAAWDSLIQYVENIGTYRHIQRDLQVLCVEKHIKTGRASIRNGDRSSKSIVS